MDDLPRGEERVTPYWEGGAGHPVSKEGEHFDSWMAIDVVEDALTALGSSEGRAFAAGLCGAFYMCGLLDDAEWRHFMRRISARGSWRASFRAGGGPRGLG